MQNSISPSAAALLVALAGLVVAVFLWYLERRSRTSWQQASVRYWGSEPPRGDPTHEEPFTIRRYAIVDQLDDIDHTNRKQIQSITATMLESSDWQALGQQFDELVDKRLEHLRVLAKRHSGLVTSEQALGHTTESYRLSRLILALYDEFVAKSDAVTRILDEWFIARRGMTTAEFSAHIHVDCARILLLDLDYAKPSHQTTLTQLNLAEKHCTDVSFPKKRKVPLCGPLLSEIALRKERLRR